LAKDFEDNIQIQRMKELLPPEELCSFACILTPTEALSRYFEELGSAVPVVIVPPCIAEIPPQNVINIEESCVLAYMGESFRDESFVKVVMPAIKKLAVDRRIKVLCPSRMDLTAYMTVKNLEIIQIPFAHSMTESLINYRHYNPHFLLHCGSVARNNIYKIENAMMNATQMGAVLIANNMSTYAKQEGNLCLCAENTIESWYEKISDIMAAPKKAKLLYHNAYTYCFQTYDSSNAAKIMEEALDNIEPLGVFELVKRCEKLKVTKMSRPLGRTSLSYVGALEKNRTYRIVCHNDVFSELGICFATSGVARGKVSLKVCDSNRLVRESSLKMEDMVWNNWSYFEFAPIDYARDKVFDIVLSFQYADNSPKIGLFEEADKRSFLYRVLNKLGIQLKIKNLLYVDCR